MDPFIILGTVVLIAFVVLGALFYMLSKEGQKKEEKVVPITDLEQLKKDFSPHLFEQKDPKVLEKGPEIIPVLTPKVSLPTQEVQPSLIETLTKENESLKSQQADLEQAQQKLIELQGETSNLKTENTGLQTQLGSANAKVRLLEEEISRANATVSELNQAKEVLLSAPKSGPDEEALRHELESLKYELIKARAQSSGLERVSSNYKNQLEDLLRKSK